MLKRCTRISQQQNRHLHFPWTPTANSALSQSNDGGERTESVRCGCTRYCKKLLLRRGYSTAGVAWREMWRVRSILGGCIWQ